MDDIWIRLGLIAGAVAVAAASVLVLRSRATETKRTLVETGLQPGVYFFSSSECPDCSHTRQALSGSLGEQGYVELRWEDDPEVFRRLSVDAVPATLVVSADGSGTLWPGGAEPALESLGP